ncbi:hypothetical protein B9Z19DRAFT_1087583 [Tuber borchii]|uniref:Uncharacterized protein n=1 Tax=Tuber borchii TaxID=42251 RepID=A0A2T6ZN04_TUBBO|nr:hypothetical protein B9Z19DRAFT_1087583 [Tuber borchii]
MRASSEGHPNLVSNSVTIPKKRNVRHLVPYCPTPLLPPPNTNLSSTENQLLYNGSTVSPLTELVLPNFLPAISRRHTLSHPWIASFYPHILLLAIRPPPVFTHQSLTFPTAVDVVAMLDAREVCSGEIGRKGGHIKPNSGELFLKLVAIFGREKARKVTEFRMGILDKMIAIADAEGVEAVDVYFDAESWATAKSCLGIYLEEFSKEIRKWETYEGEEVSLQGVRYYIDWMGGSTPLINRISGIITISSNS